LNLIRRFAKVRHERPVRKKCRLNRSKEIKIFANRLFNLFVAISLGLVIVLAVQRAFAAKAIVVETNRATPNQTVGLSAQLLPLWKRTLPHSRTFLDSISALTCRLVNPQIVVTRLVSDMVKHRKAEPISL
jgi:hypothetical protein